MPEKAKILCLQTQNGEPYIWAEVNPEDNITDRRFTIFGTGHAIEESYQGEYISTFQLENGALVFHVYMDSPQEGE